MDQTGELYPITKDEVLTILNAIIELQEANNAINARIDRLVENLKKILTPES